MPYIDDNLARLHEAASGYAVAVNTAITERFKGAHPYPLAGGALYRLQADTLSFHEAVFALCITGYVSCCAPLLRTQLDLLLSTAIVVHRREEAEIRGFRCTHFFLKATFVRNETDAQLREHSRQQIEFGIARLKPADQKKRANLYSRIAYQPIGMRPTTITARKKPRISCSVRIWLFTMQRCQVQPTADFLA